MIKISYEPDKYDDVDAAFGNGKCEVCFDDGAILIEALYGFIKVCEFAGYSAGSFDYILKEYEKGDFLKDYCADYIDALTFKEF